MARPEMPKAFEGDALPVATSHAEPYASKLTTAFGGLANSIQKRVAFLNELRIDGVRHKKIKDR